MPQFVESSFTQITSLENGVSMTTRIDLRYMYSILSIRLFHTLSSKVQLNIALISVEHVLTQPLLRRDSRQKSGLNALSWLKSVRNVFRKVSTVLHVEPEVFVSVHSLNLYPVESQFEVVVEMIPVNPYISIFQRILYCIHCTTS